MNIKAKFINAVSYDFTDESGKRVSGVTLNCFDTKSGKIIKAKVVSNVPNLAFGADIELNVSFSGNYVKYTF